MAGLLVVHGGVDMPADAATLASLTASSRAGWANQPDAVSAVVAAVGVLEDDPLFNAGYGSVLNSDGEVEVDAAIVDGASGRVGAVAAVAGLRHPARVAAAIMHTGPAVLVSGAGARRIADELGEPVDDLRTVEQQEVWRALQAGEDLSPFTGVAYAPNTETVGAISTFGLQVVAATSTGGVCGKPPGRIGDSAVFGAGHWADSRFAVLCSGEGEAIIRTNLALRVGERMRAGHSAQDAVEWGVGLVRMETGAVCAVVAVDAAQGAVGAAHSGFAFPVMVTRDGNPTLIEARHVQVTT